MNLITFVSIFVVVLVASAKETIDHDKVQPMPQPEPVTVSEKAAVLFKPQLYVPKSVCVPFPAVSAAGEVTGGLKGTNGNDACKEAPKGSQIYDRAGWYNGRWAIMYAWYFPKGFYFSGLPSKRHDWKNAVVWIDNPELEKPKILGVSMSLSDSKYLKETTVLPEYFAGYRRIGLEIHKRQIYGSDTSLRFEYKDYFKTNLVFASEDGQYQDLIMWEQLTDAARGALNDNDNFEETEVPFNDSNYKKHLEFARLL